MTKNSQLELFRRIAEQFDGFRFDDEELRLKRFHVGDPRDDPRYRAGPPEAGVELLAFEFLYEVPKVDGKLRKELACMFGNHRHFTGAAFVFSDGALRCVGRNCFQELAMHTGLEVTLVKRAVRLLTERQGHLNWFDRAQKEVDELLGRLHAPRFLDRCEAHDEFFDVLRRANLPAYKFAAKVASDHGRVLQYRILEEKKGGKTVRRRETYVVDLQDWQVFQAVPSARYKASTLASSLGMYRKGFAGGTSHRNPAEFKRMRERLTGLADDVRQLENRVSRMVRFCQGVGLRRFVELWNDQAPAGFELGMSGAELISGIESIPTHIRLAA